MHHKYLSSMSCSFYLNAAVETFASRIGYLTRFIFLEDFHTPEGFITLQTANIHCSHRIDRPHVIYIAGRYYTVEEFAAVADSVSNLFSFIQFDVSPSREKRLQVNAACFEPALDACFKGLLLRIWSDYPEARPGVEYSWPAVRNVASHPVTIDQFDQDIAQALSNRQQCTFTRQEKGSAILYTICHDNTELGWIKISPTTGLVPGPCIAYGSTALTRLLQAQESGRTAREEKPRIHLLNQIFADVRQSTTQTRWAAEQRSQQTTTHPSVPPIPPPTSQQYIFCKRGEFWEVAFDAPPFFLKHVKGLSYVAILLQNPFRQLDVMELVAALEKTTAGAITDQQVERTLGTNTRQADDYPILDEQARAEYRDRLQELHEERQRATILDDTDRLLEIQEETEEIERQLRAATGLGGRSRTFATPRKSARSSVQQAIKTAFDKIHEHSPALYDYLRSTISTGYHCSYTPNPDGAVDWEM